MLKFKLSFGAGVIALLLWILAAATMAQEAVPPPYAGLKNPFRWNDTAAQEAGKGIYQRACLGCHGSGGSNIAAADFGNASYRQNLEQRPDFHFWMVSEGRLDKGMPPFKSSLNEEQRWQVLTYIWSLAATPPETPPPPVQPPSAKGILTLTVPEQAKAGQLLSIVASLKDSQGEPIENAEVKFLLKVDFFTKGLMEVGEATTDKRGAATFEYALRQAGNVELVARSDAAETVATLIVAEADVPFYQPDAGIQLPALGEKAFIGPESAFEPGKMGEAPTSAFWLPVGASSWLLLLAITVILIWFTYFRVLYQVLHIPIVGEIRETNTRLVPLVGLFIVIVLGISLVLCIITGPISHPHLLR